MISKLIYKHLNNEASENEVTLVFKWIEASEENRIQYIALKKLWALTAQDETEKVKTWKYIEKEISSPQKRRRFKLWKYAAILVLLVGLVKLISLIDSPEVSISNEIVLQLGDGNINHIQEEQEKNILDNTGNIIAKQHSNEIIYRPNAANKDIVYHTLKVPYGKTFKVTLSDGSIIHLNSGTTLKYPEQFDLNGQRKVYLTGEAFFEIEKDEKRPFIVHSNEFDVEVLGTKFNISSNPDDESTSIVLVEGLVSLSESTNAHNNIQLSPNSKATWNEMTNSFEIEKVDVNIYTAWVHGELIFKDVPFTFISKKLERAYNVKIINNNLSLNSQKFTGTIKIKESTAEDILALFNIDTPLSYSNNNNSITITKLDE